MTIRVLTNPRSLPNHVVVLIIVSRFCWWINRKKFRAFNFRYASAEFQPEVIVLPRKLAEEWYSKTLGFEEMMMPRAIREFVQRISRQLVEREVIKMAATKTETPGEEYARKEQERKDAAKPAAEPVKEQGGTTPAPADK